MKGKKWLGCDSSTLYLYLDLIYHAFFITFALIYDKIHGIMRRLHLAIVGMKRHELEPKFHRKASFIDKRRWHEKGGAPVQVRGSKLQKWNTMGQQTSAGVPDQRKGANPSAQTSNLAQSAPSPAPLRQ